MNRGRLKLVIIFAAFLGPLLAAFIGYYGFGGLGGLGGLGGPPTPRVGTNHAPLLSPMVPLQPFSNATVDAHANANARITFASLKQHWSVIHTLAEQCQQSCEQALYHTRQTRLALGKDANRVQRILLSPNRALLNRLATAHPDAIRVLVHAAGDESPHGLENQLRPIIRQHNLGADDALLVDPLGNLMMIIPASLDPGRLLKDLKHLLKVSRIG